MAIDGRKGALMRRYSGLPVLGALFLFSMPVPSSAADRHTSAELFAVYADTFSSAPVSKAGFEVMIPDLEKYGFSTSDGRFWRMSDSSGRVVLFVLGDSVDVMYFPSPPSALGDAALAALISRARSVEIGDGDQLILTVRLRDLSGGQREGTRYESLKFSLRGGIWRETEVSIHWK
jgi:hypothetical protein